MVVSKGSHQVDSGGRRLDLGGKSKASKGEKSVFLTSDSAVIGVINRKGDGLIPFPKLTLRDIHKP